MARRGKGIDTDIVDGGRRPEWRGRLVSPPVHRGSTILFDSIADLRAAEPKAGTYYYGLHGTPNHWALAEALTDLEPGAAGTALLPSGLAAVTTALMTVLSAGDEVLMVDSVYGPTRRFCDRQLRRMGISTRYYDPLIGGDIEALIGEKTRAIFLESPGSLTMEVQDVPGICRIAKNRGIVTLIDNTWATPFFFPVLAVGVDLSIMAVTKYIGGHSDLLLGAVTANAEWFKPLQRTVFDLGFAVSPDDAWLAARGLRTLAVRLRHHEQSALRLAQWLQGQPQIARVLHPALPDCPGHEFWQRDFAGSSGLFTIELKDADEADRTRFIEGLRHFAIGYSWGGFESLVVPADPQPGRSVANACSMGPLVRLHVGLEDVADLQDDLEQALALI